MLSLLSSRLSWVLDWVLTGGMEVNAWGGKPQTQDILRGRGRSYVFLSLSGCRSALRAIYLFFQAEISSRGGDFRSHIQPGTDSEYNGDESDQILATRTKLSSSGSLLRGLLTLAHGTRYYSKQRESRPLSEEDGWDYLAVEIRGLTEAVRRG